MSLNATWVPMRWPCGPIEVARVSKSRPADSDLRKTVEGWTQPATLQLLKETPIDCLVVDWASGIAEDEAQQRALKPLIAAGRELGLSFVGKVAARDDLAAIAAAGRAAGLAAIIVIGPASDGPANRSVDLPVISSFSRDGIDWDAATDIFSVAGNVWPGVVLPTMKGDTGVGGPTGEPWMDSNGWLASLARQMVPHKSVWLEIDLPESPEALPAESYCRAIADSRAHGSHWILALDGAMRTGMLNGNPQDLSAWKSIGVALSFFEEHAEWAKYEPMGILTVVSDFKGPNWTLSGETLNLLSRRHVQYKVLDRRLALANPVTNLKAVLWTDDDPPTSEQNRNLLDLVEQGGLAIAPKYWGPAGVVPRHESWLPGYDIYGLGKGRIVVASAGFTDPFQLARDAHLLVGRENDLARLFNPGTTNCFTSMGSDHSKEIIQIVNYASHSSTYLAVWAKLNAHRARLWSPDSKTPHPLECVPESDGTSFELPEFSVNCAIEIERMAIGIERID